MGLEHIAGGEEHFVGRHQGQVVLVGQVDQRRLDGLFHRQFVAHELHIKATGDTAGQTLQHFLRRRPLPFGQQAAHCPGGPAGQRDQPPVMDLQLLQTHLRIVCGISVQVGQAQQLEEVLIAGLILDQQHQLVRLPSIASLPADVQLAADDGLNAGRRRRLGKFHGAEQVVGVGHRHGGHGHALAQAGQTADLNRPFRKGVGGMDAKMDETRIGHGGQDSTSHEKSQHMLRVKPDLSTRFWFLSTTGGHPCGNLRSDQHPVP